MGYFITERRNESGETVNADCFLTDSMDKVKEWISNNKDFDTRDIFWYWTILKITTDDELGAELFTYFDWDGNEQDKKPSKLDIGKDIFSCFSEEKFIFNVCMSYRHDFGLLSYDEQELLKFECKEWMRAIKNNYKL
jgi:hypothetical protein